MCRTPGCFLQSLSTDASGFKLIKENLTTRLFQLYNTSVFESKVSRTCTHTLTNFSEYVYFRVVCKALFLLQLPAGMSVSWNKKMRKTAGYCITGQERVGGNRYARIELSEKVCDSAGNSTQAVDNFCFVLSWRNSSVPPCLQTLT